VDVYEHLAYHLSRLGMGMPDNDDLREILKANLTPMEAEVALLFPTRVTPMQPVSVDVIASSGAISREKLVPVLEALYEKGFLFSGRTSGGEIGYALHQVGFGFPQTFFWKGEENPHNRKMAASIAKYFNRNVTREAYGSTKTKTSRYIPPTETTNQDIEAVLPYHMMDWVVSNATQIAVANCSCRMAMKLLGKSCEHPMEVCLKFDEMAQYLIDSGQGREITKQEARNLIKTSEQAGLVHFVDNCIEGIKHNCNCCGCACWNVGSIKRRKIPRDTLMATYFLRVTEQKDCTGCEHCLQVCPVDALTMKENFPLTDNDWCIGCGVCVAKCPADAAKLTIRADIEQPPIQNFKMLHEKILKEKGLA